MENCGVDVVCHLRADLLKALAGCRTFKSEAQ